MQFKPTTVRALWTAVSAAALLVILLLGLIWLAPAATLTAAPAADCGSGNFFGTYQDNDLTLAGDLYVTDNVLIRNGIAITITPTSSVTFCGPYRIRIEGGGDLIANGTPTQTIIFNADNTAVRWDAIQFIASHGERSSLRYVELNYGGEFKDAATPNGAIYISSNATNMPSPVIDHVTINDSGDYGIFMRLDSDDRTPPAVNHVAINNSSNAAILTDAEGLGGLGLGNSFSGNMPNTIQLTNEGGSRLFHSQTWRNQGVPVEILGDLMVAANSENDAKPVLTVEPGTTFLLHPGVDFQIGSSLGRGGSLVAEGTPAAPIVFTRASSSSAPWRSLRLELETESFTRLSHVAFSYGGDGTPGMVHQLGNGLLTMDQVTVTNSIGTGLYSREGLLNMRDSSFTGNDIGMAVWSSTDAVIRNSSIFNNVTAGLESVDTNFNDNCVDAVGNFWGSADGPLDTYAAADFCGPGRTNAGSGDPVSGGVRYAPWLAGSGGQLQDRGAIRPQNFYVLANGIDSTIIEISLRDAQGNPLAGKQVQLDASVGAVQQPAALTDASGRTTAVISSTQPGYAYLTAFNVTDNTSVSGIGGVTFWQGSGDVAGLVDPAGTPYAFPELIIDGRPFQQGFPMGFRLPMQNSTPSPTDVQVIYGVSNLNIGVRFTPVFTTETRTLQPGESWEAPGNWTPLLTGHRCVQATVIVDGGPELRVPTGSIWNRQKNTDTNPCDNAVNNIGKARPGRPSFNGRQDLQKVGKHFFNVGRLFDKANRCFRDELVFRAPANGRDYEVIAQPPTITAPLLQPDADLNQAQVDALNAVGQISADIYAIRLALQSTATRVYHAAISDAPDADYYQTLQYDAYRTYNRQYAGLLYDFADAMDQVLAVTEGAGIPDANYEFSEYQTTLADLQANGFDADTLTFYQQAGLTPEQIDYILEEAILALENEQPEVISFYDYLRETQEEARQRADRLVQQYGTENGRRAQTDDATFRFEPMDFTFEVGNPTAVTDTVTLEARSINIPVNWSYQLAQDSFTLGPDEVVTATMTLYPGGSTLSGDLVQVAVEGYIDGNLIGGILLEHQTPGAAASQLFLPIVTR